MLRSFVLYAISKEKVESLKRFTKKKKTKIYIFYPRMRPPSQAETVRETFRSLDIYRYLDNS